MARYAWRRDKASRSENVARTSGARRSAEGLVLQRHFRNLRSLSQLPIVRVMSRALWCCSGATGTLTFEVQRNSPSVARAIQRSCFIDGKHLPLLRAWGALMRRVMFILCASLVTSGCATTPNFEKITGVTPKTIVDVLECEIIAAKKKNALRKVKERRLQRMRLLPKNYIIRDLTTYVAAAELTLQVDEQATLVPSFTHTEVVSKTFTLAFDWGVKLDTQSHRAYSESITFTISRMSNDKNSCERLRTGISLNGKLGIEKVSAL